MEYFRQRYINELNDEGPVKIRTVEWSTVEVFQSMDPEAYDADFVEWLGAAKEAAKDRAREFLTEYGCLQRFNWLSARCAQERVM